MTQPDLFARARRTDPGSSHAAAEQVERDGTAGRQRDAAYSLVVLHAGANTDTLSSHHPRGVDRGTFKHQLSRRLPELEKAGRIWASQDGTDPIRWWPGPKPRVRCPIGRCPMMRPRQRHGVEVIDSPLLNGGGR